LVRRLDGAQSQSGCGVEERNSQPLLGFKPTITQSLAQHYTTELSWLIVLLITCPFSVCPVCGFLILLITADSLSLLS